MPTLPWSLSPVQQLAGIVLPMRQSERDSSAAQLARWSLHLALWGAILAALWHLNRAAGIERMLRSPWPDTHRLWLPLLGVSVYALVWLGRGLWLALRSDPPASAWPDLDAAWLEARDTLVESGVDPARTPLFLILGPLTNDVQALLHSLETRPAVPHAALPFQLHVRPDALFLVCNSVSHLGVHDVSAHAVDDESLTAQLRHLCELLTRERSGQVALQGIVLIATFAASRSGKGTRALVRRARQDLQTVRDATGLEAPVYLAISGLGQLPTSTGWFQRFPPTPDLDPAELLTMFQEGSDTLCSDQIPRQLRARMRLDTSAGEPGCLTSGLLENISLYQWWNAIQTWRPRLVRLLAEAAQNEFSDPGMVAGCYFMPGDEASEASRATARALWHDLSAHRRAVAWTSASLARRARRRWILRVGYLLGVFAMGSFTTAAAWYLWSRA